MGIASAENEFACNLELEKINHLKIPDIYKFNLVNVKFVENRKKEWMMSEVSLDNNLINNLRNSMQDTLYLLRNIIEKGRMSEKEKNFLKWHIPFLTEVAGFDYGMTNSELFNHLNKEIKNMGTSERINLLKDIDEWEMTGNKYINNFKESGAENIMLIEENLNEVNAMTVFKINKGNLEISYLTNSKDEYQNIIIKNILNASSSNPIEMNAKSDIYTFKFIGNCTNLSLSEVNPKNEKLVISDSFIEFCKNSKLSELDKSVARLCLEKMN